MVTIHHHLEIGLKTLFAKFKPSYVYKIAFFMLMTDQNNNLVLDN